MVKETDKKKFVYLLKYAVFLELAFNYLRLIKGK